jgi:hypothetical protein
MGIMMIAINVNYAIRPSGTKENTMHPLAPNLTELSDDDLHKKRAELQNRMSQAYRFGSADMVGQLQLLLQDYAMEVERRNQVMLDQAQKSGRINNNDNSAKDITN